MAGDDFSLRDEANKDAQRHYQAKFGSDVRFPDGNEGRPIHGTQGIIFARGFMVTDALGEPIAHYAVSSKGKGFTWQEIPGQER
jgi:hypothetical protein